MSAKVVYLPRCLVVTRLVPRETAAVSRYVYTIQLSTSLQCRFNPGYIRKVHVCLAVICHLHFWQNERDFLRVTAVTRGWNGYRNETQHRKLTTEKFFN